ncbi:MAG: methyltransferase domain-containing protein [Alphaproteobacteria bacterium]|jgi:SAM-dependent methyltransferase|nr:methyltransferase domain-containing protein [Alphaproteobacteria bacterium]
MRPDVYDLREFYHGPLGRVARNLVRREIRRIWSDVGGRSVLGLGYATPYLRPFRGEAERVIALMPAIQGISRWPDDGPNLVALSEEHDLPLPDASVERVLIVHELENTENVRALLREAWRVLTLGGRLLVVVPNRRGLWARFERTPFGHGRPYSQGQLGLLLKGAMFQPTERSAALYLPPFRSRMLLRTAPVWERLGRGLGATLAGVLLVEADKQIYAATAVEARARRRRRPVPIAVSSRAAASRQP